MAIAKQLVVINDFSSGEVDTDLKRGSDSVTQTGGRQMVNWRVLNSRRKANRPGRTALFFETGRVEKVLMAPGSYFYLVFGNGYLRVYNAAGARVFTSTVKGNGSTAIPWTSATVKSISFVLASDTAKTIYIFYADGAPNNVPQILTWDGVSQTSTWTLSTFAETIEASGQKRTVFYRLSPQNVTMLPSATSGNINITFSSNILVAGMVGMRMRFCNRQILITGVSSGIAGTATVIEPLPPSQALVFSASSGTFNGGQELVGATSGATGIVTSTATQQTLTFHSASWTGIFPGVGDHLTGGTSGATGIVIATFPGSPSESVVVQLSTGTIFQVSEVVTDSATGGSGTTSAVGGGSLTVQLIPNAAGDAVQFLGTEVVAGPNGSGTLSSATVGVPQAVSVWDDEVMNTFRGYPLSAFFDQNRLGLCNFPSLPSGIGWSTLGLSLDFYPDASSPDDAIFELAPGKVQVLYVVPGMESSEFVFCDKQVFYIPISQAQPLEPGSVAFTSISDEGCYPVQPQPAEQTVLYIKAGGLQVGAVQAPGAYYRPYIVDTVAEFHSHLFTASPPIALAIPPASTQFQELYAYILLANGTALCGRYGIRSGLLDVGPEGKPKIGWLPWNGAGTLEWISANTADVIFTTSYAPGGVTAISIVEKLDATQYLDAAVSVNNLPTALTPPPSKGPLWWIAGGTAFLIDIGTRFMGTYQVDANGFIVPQNQGGENLASAQLVAGQMWTALYEPFLPHAGAGQDEQQGTRRLKIIRAAVSVQNSTGFVWGARRIPAYFIGDDATKAAPLREYTYRFRFQGRDFDPRAVLIKDSPGPLTVLEHRIRLTV